jgi:hypothetical protein
MTFNVAVDTSTGHIDILSEMGEEEEDNLNNVRSNPSKPLNNLDNFDRDYLSKQFFELNK